MSFEESKNEFRALEVVIVLVRFAERPVRLILVTRCCKG